MTTNPVFESLYRGFRLTIGATASLLETLQDPRKRADTLTEFQTYWQQIAQEWSEKGEVTEQEARQFIEEWLNRHRSQRAPEPENEPVSPVNSTPADNADVSAEIKKLTEQLTALRDELENSRQSKS